MRFSLLALLAGSATLAGAQSFKGKKTKEPTVFNSIEVPPLLELTPTNWEEEIKKSKFLFVKHYSPYCPHCIEFAPMFQTFYEFYYTSKPAIKDADKTTFSEYYDFRFAMINCVAHYDFCSSRGISTYPLTLLFEDGEQVAEVRGTKDLPLLGDAVEPILEKYKPGSRPAVIEYPVAGAKESPAGNSASAESKEPAQAGAVRNPVDDATEVTGLDTDKSPHTHEGGSADKPVDASEKPLAKDTDKTDKTTTSSSESNEAANDKSTQPSSPPKSDKYLTEEFKVPTPAEVYNSKKPKRPLVEPNASGVSIALTAESFQKLVTTTQDPWFIKFYAPWCPHCQAMGPTWEQLAKNMRGKLNIGEVNCDKESRLCKDVHARSYPTLLFFKGGERAEYQGLRGLGDFVQYAENALDLASGVQDVDAQDFAALEAKEEVIFVYFYDHATTSEDFLALERLPLSLIGHAKLVKTNDRALYDRFKITTWPRLLVSREGRPTYYTPLTPDEMRDVHRLLDWMKSVWLPLVPEMTASNAKQTMDHKITVLGILNREDEEGFQTAIREMKSAANEWMDRQIQEFQLERKKLRDSKQMRIEEAEDRDDQRALRAAKAIRIDMDNSGRKEVAFAWVDGVFWQRWIRTTYGADSRKYWDTTVTGNYILVSRTSIMETLDKVVYGPQVIKAKLTVSIVEKIFIDVRGFFSDHPILSACFVMSALLAGASWFRNRVRRSKGGYFRLDDSLGRRDFKDGLGILGQNGNTKAD
ncbi:hypothetical protein S40285_00964 [Stachybotrys chlorohalonatus IBT 40285]|uniref:Thioredoxin domain-containing protein n=1 Tax=Stachybotrys chlorohalonatus (strain IBT 40285) TaxID=1283841 RepID=A0A084QUT2_STAC4|nr:hypothetical protein S40285_00964 [Stachybotrys chlorohalonata IBT 40285]